MIPEVAETRGCGLCSPLPGRYQYGTATRQSLSETAALFGGNYDSLGERGIAQLGVGREEADPPAKEKLHFVKTLAELAYIVLRIGF